VQREKCGKDKRRAKQRVALMIVLPNQFNNSSACNLRFPLPRERDKVRGK
jgi:hypothetical protein